LHRVKWVGKFCYSIDFVQSLFARLTYIGKRQRTIH